MVTTPDDPYITLPKLRYKRIAKSDWTINTGQYYLIDEHSVTAIFKRIHVDDEPSYGRKTRTKAARNTTEQIFHVQVNLRNVGKKKNHQLVWAHYSVEFRRSNGQEAISTFDLTPSRFPPFYYSRVKSYSATTEAPLV